MTDIFVKDPRPDGDESFRAVNRRLTTLRDVVQLVTPVGIDRQLGWDAAPVGEACWKLVGFHVTVGIQEISPFVLDKDGHYLPGKKVHWFFPGAPDSHTQPAQPAYHPRAFVGETKGPPDNNGAHFTITGDHNVAPGHPGPDWVWVAVEPGGPQFSDAVNGLGMRVNTNHLVVSPIFQHVVKTSQDGSDGQSGPGEPVVVVPDADPGTGHPPGPGAPDEPSTSAQPGEAPVQPAPTVSSGDTYVSIVVKGKEVGRIPFEPVDAA